MRTPEMGCMKALLEYEDCIAGIIMGVLVLGYEGTLSIPYAELLLEIGSILFLLFILFDIVNEIKDPDEHLAFTLLAIVHNIIDAILMLGFIDFFFELNIPLIGEYLVPYIGNLTFVYGIGIFLIASNALWFINVVRSPLTKS